MIRVWDLHHPETSPMVLSGHQDYVCSVAFSPDGKKLASSSGDNTIRIWDLQQPRLDPVLLVGHSDDVLSVAFSPDGQTLASGSADKTIRVWDLHQPEAVPLILARHQGRVFSVAFSPDGRHLASGSEDKNVLLWGRSRILADIACQLVWRNLTLGEWRLFVGEGVPYERTCSNLPPGEGAPASSP
jgi:WD40 repeat protein